MGDGLPDLLVEMHEERARACTWLGPRAEHLGAPPPEEHDVPIEDVETYVPGQRAPLARHAEEET